MAFGFTRGAIANGIGKIGGSLLAFAIGRFILRDFVMSKLQGNEYLDLIERSIQKGPIRVALIWRLSPLPEFMKNFGLALLPLKMSHFAIAVLLHGLPFTLLWSFMGNEMGLVVRYVDGLNLDTLVKINRHLGPLCILFTIEFVEELFPSHPRF